MGDRQRPAEDLVLQRLTKTFLQRGKAPVNAVNGIDLTVGTCLLYTSDAADE